jgi:hypothetical protein
MPSLADVFRVLNELKREGVVEDYAIGGAMAALFYALDDVLLRHGLQEEWRRRFGESNG